MTEEILFYSAMLVWVLLNAWYTSSAIADYYDDELLPGDTVACAFSWICLFIVVGFEVVR